MPRLLDHMNAADGPSDDEEEEKDAKRQRSAPTAPRSTSSIHPHEYDEIMCITQVEPRDAERFEEGNESDFQDAEETAARETETSDKTESDARGPGEIHGGMSSATLQECIERVQQQSAVAPATLHSGEGIEKSSDPPHSGIVSEIAPKLLGRKNNSWARLLSRPCKHM